MLGHPIGASGAANMATALMSINDGIVTPTINYENPDPLCDLDYVPNVARVVDVRTAISNTFAFGSKNSCIVVRSH